jgi:adenine-specific DNA-methyltransferase
MAGKLQIQESFQKVYDLEVFKREILNSIFTSEKAKLFREENYIDESNQLTASEKKAILKVVHYGNLELDDYNTLKLYEITLQPKVRIEQSKVGIQQYVRKMLIAGEGVLVNFINPDNLKTWRLTLVASDTVLTDKGISVKKLNPKRYTFIVGQSEKCKTISDRFADLEKASRIVLYPSENEKIAISLVNIFSVETLSKAFFDEYTLHYKLFTEYLQNSNFRKSIFNITIPQNAKKEELDIAYKPIRDFTKKLLGRIVFLYFVQKKGWLGATDLEYKDGDPDFIFKLFMSSGANETFYELWLKNLFFDTLNKGGTERPNDVFVMPDKDKTKVKIPFLNGGLFDKEDFDNKLLTFTPTLFHSDDFEDVILTDKLFKKNDSNHRGFLDFLNSFNFTVHEDSPEDHTVAVDPEMLGHIFENLLEDNKDKGAFYTPKEIVHYMCQESLIEYLTTHLSKEYTVYRAIGNQQVEMFGNEIAQGQLQMMESLGDKALDREAIASIVKNKDISSLTAQQLTRMSDLLNTVKICDPAIGSGAFPMGLLQEIFAIKELIAVHTNQNFDAAKTKENIIQNSIYGVDIEKGAVDIARLRFWLSLIVNEEKPKALPNLDYKIVVGDSLLSKFEEEIIEIDWNKTGSVGKADDYVKNVQRLLKEVAKKQKDYFNEEGKSKKGIAAEIRDLKIDLLINQLSFNKESYTNKNSVKIDNGLGLSAKDLKNNELILNEIYNFDKNIKKLIELKKDSLKPFNHFDWKLDFPEVLNPYLFENKDNVGFDIVIANPPYIDSETMVSMGNIHIRDYLTKKLNFCKGNWDIYIAFFDVSFHFLNPTGNLVFITPDKWISKPFGNEIRLQLLENYIKIAEAGRDVFKNAKVDSIITFIGKYETKDLEIDKFYNNTVTHLDTVSKSNIVEPYTFDWLFSDYISLIKKIEIFPSKFKDYGICENACSTSDTYKLKEYILDINDTFDSDEYLKIINTGTISKYVSRWGHSEMTYLKDKLHPEKQYKYLKPVVKKKDFLKNFNNSYSKKSIKPKIIIKGLTLLDACIDIEGIIIPGKSTLIITKELSHSNDLYLLLGLVNSKIFIFYIKEKYRGSSYNTGINFNMDMINDVPVPLILENNKLLIIQVVKYIIFSKENKNDIQNDLISTYFEQIIDGMVYELYFPEILKQHNRTIIEHLGELPAFTDSMSDNQKMEITTTVFNRLNEKNHPVRVNLFYMNSIPEIAIIEGKKEKL